MSLEPAGALVDQILSEIGPFMAHQRHKWAAQCHSFGLSMTHFQVLAILDADGPTPMSRLAEQLEVGFSNVSGSIGRLEERGVVTRVHDAEDRRMVLAQLTPAGVEMLRHVEETRLGHMRQLVETLTPKEQVTVLTALKTLTAAHDRVHVSGEHAKDHVHAQPNPARDAKELLHA
jgi:MarR family 2-MHQ and catechol resistance regulon transcriptional repressor